LIRGALSCRIVVIVACFLMAKFGETVSAKSGALALNPAHKVRVYIMLQVTGISF